MDRRIFCFVFVLSLLIPNLSLSDTWEDFQEFSNGFYFLDDQNFKSLSCTIALPEFQDMLNENRNQIQAAGKHLLIEENLTDFRLVFSKNGSLIFIKPDLTIQIVETEAPDKDNLETGARMIESGFKTTVDGAVMTLEGLFTSYVRPDRPEYRLESFLRENSKTFIRYEQKGMLTDVVCSGMECTRTILTATADVESNEVYALVDGQKILQTMQGVIKQSQQTIATDLSITYQLVRGLRIPQKVNARATITYPMGTMNGAFSIILKDCQVE